MLQRTKTIKQGEYLELKLKKWDFLAQKWTEKLSAERKNCRFSLVSIVHSKPNVQIILQNTWENMEFYSKYFEKSQSLFF